MSGKLLADEFLISPAKLFQSLSTKCDERKAGMLMTANIMFLNMFHNHPHMAKCPPVTMPR